MLDVTYSSIAADITQSACVCLLVTAVSPTKMAEWIEMPFGDRDSAGDQGTMY